MRIRCRVYKRKYKNGLRKYKNRFTLSNRSIQNIVLTYMTQFSYFRLASLALTHTLFPAAARSTHLGLLISARH